MLPAVVIFIGGSQGMIIARGPCSCVPGCRSVLPYPPLSCYKCASSVSKISTFLDAHIIVNNAALAHGFKWDQRGRSLDPCRKVEYSFPRREKNSCKLQQGLPFQ